MLSLSGVCGDLELHPNSLHLPLLEWFICKASGANMLIRAIVAPNVAHFTYLPAKWETYDTESIFLSFPAVHHVDLDRNILVSVFQQGNIPNLGYWPNLESLTVHKTDARLLEFLGGLITWLEGRKNMQRPTLLVKLVFSDFYLDWSIITTLYEALHKRCILEWGNIRLHSDIVFSSTADGPPWFVGAFRLIVTLVRQS